MMSPVQQKYEFILDEAAKFLASEDFHRSDRCLRKRLPNGEVRWSICFQKHRRSTADDISFTADISADLKRRSVYWDPQPRTTWYVGMGDRIGHLMPKKEDTWWDIDPRTSAEFLSDQINAVLSSSVLPFLRQFQTEQNIRDYLRAQENDEMRRNYPHAFTVLELDLLEKKEKSEIEKRIHRIRFLGKIHLMDKKVVDATIERVLKAYGYNDPLPARTPWWKFWA